jgi:ERCC4-type nuclease
MNTEYKLIIDTRENLPLPFKKNVIFKKLNVGDYGVELNNKLLPIFFERKSGIDCLGTLTKSHKRFQQELGRAYEDGVKIIMIVECSYIDFIEKKFYGAHNSKIKPDVLTKILHSTIISHDLQIVFCNNRQEMTRYIRNYFNALVKYEVKHNPEKYGIETKKREKVKAKVTQLP